MNQTRKAVNVAVGIPNKGHTAAESYDNHLELFHHLGKLQALSSHGVKEDDFSYPEGFAFKFHIILIARVFPALARERLCERALEAGCDYILMYDEDMLLPPDLFEKLYRHGKDIVAPLAFTRLGPHRPVIYNLTSGWDSVEQKEYYINLPVMTYPKNQLVQVDAVGFGAVLIHLKILSKIKKPWFMTTSGSGEDIHFCHSAGKAGFKIYADTSVKLVHLGDPLLVTEELYESAENIEHLRKVYGDEHKYPQTERKD